VIGRALRPLLGPVVPTPPVAVPPGVQVRCSRWLPRLGGLLTRTRHAAAVTLGDTIVVHPDVPLSSRLLRHELEHVRQWREQPWSFAARYAFNHLRYGYHLNPFEVAARRAEADAAARRP
jgi:hypothetical protein